MPIASNARTRLAQVARQTGLAIPEDARQLESWSNDVWRCGDVMVRVCFAGDRDRLVREAHIGRALPSEARYPRVLDFGRDDELAWMLVERLQGESVHRSWREMEPRQLRPIVDDLADTLRVLHAWEPPDDVWALLHAHAVDSPQPDADSVIGHDILPLPAPRWRPLVDAALLLPFVDVGMTRAVAALLDELAAHDPFARVETRVVHGDVNFSNLLVHDGRLVALLDYEWARLGPPDAELTQLLRSSRHWVTTDPVPPPVVDWIEARYPEMFAAPDLRERVWVSELAYQLRQLVLWPPSADEAPSHPVNMLPRLLDGPWLTS